MVMPLKTIVKTCWDLEQSDQMKEYEASEFIRMLQNARIFSNLMVLQLKDMQDWNLLKTSNFRKVSKKFRLP